MSDFNPTPPGPQAGQGHPSPPIHPNYLPPHPALSPGQVYLPPPPPRWPKVIGIIAIILGSLALLAILVLLMPLYTGFMRALPLPPQSQAQMAAMEAWQAALMVMGVVQAGLGALALAGGISLLKRRQRGRKLLLIYAPLEIVRAICATYVSTAMNAEQFAAIQTTTPGAMPASMVTLMNVISWVFAMMFYGAFPTVLLIWLNRAKIREQVARWEV